MLQLKSMDAWLSHFGNLDPWILLGALTVGLCLGLLGSGGSIITTPALIFLANRPDKLAITESLAIVGCVALVGSAPYAYRRQIDWSSVMAFGLFGMMGSYGGAVASCYITGQLQMLLFALVLLMAGSMMFFRKPTPKVTAASHQPIGTHLVYGFLVGSLTGLLGIGGGFLIVPALVLLDNLTMSLAVGTSLIIIAMNALTGFSRQFTELKTWDLQVSWPVIALFSTVGIFGTLVGSLLNSRIPQDSLRRIFGLVVLLMGLSILLRNSPLTSIREMSKAWRAEDLLSVSVYVPNSATTETEEPGIVR